MAYDGGMLRAVLTELNKAAAGAKVERVCQPAADEIDLILADRGQKNRLVINAGAGSPHMALSHISKENPAVAPMFCMLLRKHLAGAKLIEGEQLGFERAARLRFAGYDEMGYPTEKTLVVEIMGKYSNLMLLDGQDKILAVLRPVDFTTSRKRQVLSGMIYEAPPAQEKKDPLCETDAGLLGTLANASAEKTLARVLSDAYLGIASQTAAEIAFRATGAPDTQLADADKNAVCREFSLWFDNVREGNFTPTLVLREDGTPLDYTYAPSTHRGSAARTERVDSFATLLDRFFGERDRHERIRQRASDLLQLLSHGEARLTRKLAAQREELADCAKAEEYRREADLVVANIYRLSRGMTEFIATDYSGEEPRDVLVHLDGRLTPSANAQRLYKYYNKAKTAARVLGEQIAAAEEELRYLEGVRTFLDRAESEADLVEIRDELYRAGYASRMKNYTPPRSVKLRPREFTTASGYRLLCGRNNLQNEQLTFRVAEKDDLWFHAKGVPGSHVILICGGEEPPAEDYTQAAAIAAYYSAASGAPVAVDYTRVRHVKKPAGAKPGYVIYKTNYTAYVAPLAALGKPEEA
ncbi:MAG: NFACT family protein [Clostridia bacterium]|nr:NFACT family protein [Clostridia bacterium]